MRGVLAVVCDVCISEDLEVLESSPKPRSSTRRHLRAWGINRGAKASNAGMEVSHAAFNCQENSMKYDNTRKCPSSYINAQLVIVQMTGLSWNYFFPVAIAKVISPPSAHGPKRHQPLNFPSVPGQCQYWLCCYPPYNKANFDMLLSIIVHDL